MLLRRFLVVLLLQSARSLPVRKLSKHGHVVSMFPPGNDGSKPVARAASKEPDYDPTRSPDGYNPTRPPLAASKEPDYDPTRSPDGYNPTRPPLTTRPKGGQEGEELKELKGEEDQEAEAVGLREGQDWPWSYRGGQVEEGEDALGAVPAAHASTPTEDAKEGRDAAPPAQCLWSCHFDILLEAVKVATRTHTAARDMLDAALEKLVSKVSEAINLGEEEPLWKPDGYNPTRPPLAASKEPDYDPTRSPDGYNPTRPPLAASKEPDYDPTRSPDA